MISISFVVPAFNEKDYIFDCVTSIITEAKRSCDRWEVIVVDNNSTDGTDEYVPIQATVIKERKQGLVWSRTKGFKASRYPLVAFIDADAIMPINWVNAAIDAFSKNDNVVCVSGPLKFYDTPKYLNVAASGFYKIAKQMHKLYPTVQGGNFILKRKALEDIGGFDNTIQFYGEDTSTAANLSKIGDIILEPKMWINTSGRRLLQQGIINTTMTYIANYISVSMRHKPLTNTHKDYR